MISSTTHTVVGVSTSDDARIVKDHVSGVPGLGAVAIEVRPQGGAALIVKHSEEVKPDRSAIAAAVRSAGSFELV